MYEGIRDTIGYVDSCWQCRYSILMQNRQNLVGVERIMTFSAKNGSKALYLLALDHF